MQTQNKRKLVETITESLLCCVLLGILGFTFATVWSLNPVASTKNDTVLGVSVSAKPFEVLQQDTYEQTNYLGTNNSFSADYTFAVATDLPNREYPIVKLSNNTSAVRKYVIAVVIPDSEIKWFKITGKVADTEYPIYDALGDGKVYNLVVSLEPNTEETFKLVVVNYSESSPTELHASINLAVLNN